MHASQIFSGSDLGIDFSLVTMTQEQLKKALAKSKKVLSEHRRLLEESKSEKLSEASYFVKNANFRFWLLQKLHKSLDEMKHSQQRKYFKKFAYKWNKGLLSDDVYLCTQQLNQHGGEEAPTRLTKHKWNFKDVDKEQLEDVIFQVKQQSNSTDSESLLLGSAMKVTAH
ncbi:uncharacterized protein MONOS_18698 [Monocercomonoides exilis]|uniref:uncharacterized protein n=1 Tax=Monocercomonoides exilis TaxID=2049356 RepID=UPI00355A8511|nr:hypothetical protein MONOS_18698 [Monocercomonoides exilis]